MLIGIISDRPNESSLRNYGVKIVFEDLGLDYKFIEIKAIFINELLRYPLIILILNDLKLPEESLNLLNDFIINGGCLIISGTGGDSIEQKLLDKIYDDHKTGYGGKKVPLISGWLRTTANNLVKDTFTDLPTFFHYTTYKVADKTKVIMKQLDIEKEEIGAAIFLLEKGNGIIFRVAFDFFGIIGYLLSGGECILKEKAQMNSLGNKEKTLWSINDSVLGRAGLMQVPIVNEYERILFNLILWNAIRQGFPIFQKMLWPDGKRYAVCLTHDVDDVASPWEPLRMCINSLRNFKFLEGIPRCLSVFFELISAAINKYVLRSNKRNSIKYIPVKVHNLLKKYNPFWNFERFMKLERQFSAKSTFYFLDNESGGDSDYSIRDRKIVDTMKRLDNASWEVGMHGALSSFMNRTKTIYYKKELDTLIGKSTKGFRQHFLRFKIPESWEYLDEAGYIYDTTFGSSSEVGFLASTCLPFKVFNLLKNEELRLIEIPLMVMDRTLFGKNYKNFTAREALNLIKRMITVVHRNSGVLVLLWHSCFYNASIDQQEWLDVYLKALTFCKEIDNSVWITNGKEIAQWWNKRALVRLKEIKFNKKEAILTLYSNQKVKDMAFRIFVPKNKKLKSIKIKANEIFAEYEESQIGDLGLFVYNLSFTHIDAQPTQIRLEYM